MGRWVARGSLILALVREIRGSLTHPVLSIYNYSLQRCGHRPAPTHAGAPKKNRARSLRGERGLEVRQKHFLFVFQKDGLAGTILNLYVPNSETLQAFVRRIVSIDQKAVK